LHLLDEMDLPVIFAHRGASVSAPENTMAAFETAISMGAKAIELDTMLSSDGIPVVIHDHTLERTTNGHGEVQKTSYSDLILLDAGSWFLPAFKGEGIPSLRRVLEKFSNKILINIELKNYHAPHDNLAEITMQLVDELNLWDSVLFSSFLPGNLRFIRNRKPSAKIALLCPSGIKGWIFRSSIFRKTSPDFIHPASCDVDRNFIKREHRRSRRVHVWTINDETKAIALALNKVDGIFSDDPILIFKAIRQISPPNQ
jgi:glycerophosphoryl diester phosphodiesterase